MKNFVQKGSNLTLPAPYAVVSGQLVVVGHIVGVAVHDAAAGDPVTITREGVFTVTKPSALVLAPCRPRAAPSRDLPRAAGLASRAQAAGRCRRRRNSDFPAAAGTRGRRHGSAPEPTRFSSVVTAQR